MTRNMEIIKQYKQYRKKIDKLTNNKSNKLVGEFTIYTNDDRGIITHFTDEYYLREEDILLIKQIIGNMVSKNRFFKAYTLKETPLDKLK